MKIITLILLIIPIQLIAQGWERTYESGFGRSVQQTTDGGYVITGRTDQPYTYDPGIFLIRTNSNGDTVWTKKYGGQYDDYGYSVQQTNDAGFIITGYTSLDNVNSSIYLIKTDSNGDTLWTRTYEGNGWCMGYSVKQCCDEGYIIAGFTKISNRDRDVYLIKTDGNGDTLWTRTYGGTDSDIGYSVEQTIDGGYIIVGEAFNYFDTSYVSLIKTDSDGDTVWTKTYGETSYSRGYSVEQTSDEGYIITGVTGTYELKDLFLIKTNSNGDIIWTKTYGGIYHTKGHSVKQTIDGGYIVAGQKYNNETGNDVYLIKTNSNGDTIWTKTYGGSANDYGYSVQLTLDGGFIIGGMSYSINNDMMLVYLIKTDENGIITSSTEIPVPNPTKKLIKTVDLLGREIHKPENNIPFIEIYDDGTTQKKMILK